MGSGCLEGTPVVSKALTCSVVIPTYCRGQVAIETTEALLALPVPPHEVLLVDQTAEHPPAIAERLAELAQVAGVRWLRLSRPSIPAAMNRGLREAASDVVLFLDDDILPGASLIQAHLDAQAEASLVAGMVLQPGERAETLQAGEAFRFNSDAPAGIREFMGGNVSVLRDVALALGGFDENFVGAAYRFEAEFAWRYTRQHGDIRYEPRAVIHHLAIPSGGTRAHGHHLRTIQPAHSVGAYYELMRTRRPGWVGKILWRPIRSVRTRHHLRRPWWIPLTLLAELRGFLLALQLDRGGPKLTNGDSE